MSESAPEQPNASLVDGHVHIHGNYVVGELFDAALKNFQRVAHEKNLGWPCRMLLLLTETAACNEFDRIKSGATENDGLRAWSSAPTGEACSLVLRHTSGEEIIVIAGRQIVTEEKLEVLALASDLAYPDGEPIEISLERAAGDGAIIVLPWGFGKWLGDRGRIIRHLLEDSDAPTFYLGDNSGRLRYGPTPEEFSTAQQKGIRILPGSDPLPFPSEAVRVGRYGFYLDTAVSTARPATELKALLADPATAVGTYGHGEGLLRFLRNQIMMQFAKRLGPARRAAPQASNSPD